MLFDDEVVDLVTAHFVPVITDHPRGQTDPKRNPETWDRCESWKRYPNSAEIVWLVSADESRRTGLVYNPIKSPDQLLEWMEAVLVFDGGVEKPTAEQVRNAALVRMRSALGELWSWDGKVKPQQSFHDERRGFDAITKAVTDDELCPAPEAAQLLEHLRAPSDERRAELRATLGRLIAAARDAGLADADWFARFAGWHDADSLGGEAEHEAAVRMFRSWLRREVESGNVKPDAALEATFRKLGVLGPDRGDER